MNAYLFVYGTLMNKGAEPAASLMRTCSFFGKGKIKGRLYDLGEYPGAILLEAGEEYVYGDIVFMETPEMTLKLLDDYEGFGDNLEKPNLFIRELVKVENENGKVECWVYLYNLPVDGAKKILSGKYFNP